MKASLISPRKLWTALAVFATCLAMNAKPCRADSTDAQGAQVLTRGPVHEAFAGVIEYKPEAGLVAPKQPPENIEEVPPDQKPEGDNVTWIPGYWAWDDERNDFLWVSGVWRALPPGRQWVAGYWAKSGEGYQWTSGYWADAQENKTTYLPVPPAPLENGPNIAAPSLDYVWIPGCWIWLHGRYAWRPGYWIEGRPDWDWCPDYYVWTPRGYVFVDGYWDYSVERRGVLFAPVYFEYGVAMRPGYRYSPAIVIDLAVLPNHLFLRPRYHHYYFGDYYDPAYSNAGFYVSFAFQSRGYGYDPIYAHQRWEHRRDQNWENHFETKYQNRRDHVNVRPPRTWVVQRNDAKIPKPGEDRHVAAPFEQVSKDVHNPRRFQPLASDEKQHLAQRGEEVKKSREGRRTLESNPAGMPVVKPRVPFHPTIVERPKSPIVAMPFHSHGRDEAPPRPQGTHQPQSWPVNRGGDHPKNNGDGHDRHGK